MPSIFPVSLFPGSAIALLKALYRQVMYFFSTLGFMHIMPGISVVMQIESRLRWNKLKSSSSYVLYGMATGYT